MVRLVAMALLALSCAPHAPDMLSVGCKWQLVAVERASESLCLRAEHVSDGDTGGFQLEGDDSCSVRTCIVAPPGSVLLVYDNGYSSSPGKNAFLDVPCDVAACD